MKKGLDNCVVFWYYSRALKNTAQKTGTESPLRQAKQRPESAAKKSRKGCEESRQEEGNREAEKSGKRKDKKPNETEKPRSGRNV